MNLLKLALFRLAKAPPPPWQLYKTMTSDDRAKKLKSRLNPMPMLQMMIFRKSVSGPSVCLSGEFQGIYEVSHLRSISYLVECI